ncbi:NAD-dependent epimerase/dehydratase family protein [Nocardia brevicatena]|uniref:NAD-dependent epimerase/dehydratase family protein n=1 Tax=Nocardia brevicatena TaxID=37327 RepID=UPI001C3F27EB|nr:NAD-dependent epimerase/dehydratase family protein [Nocardia brevicatena]
MPALTDAFVGADAVVHLAWAIHPRREDPPMARTNAVGSAHIAHAAAAAGVPQLVCASSAAAYTPAERWHRVDEHWAVTGVPGSAYSRGKAVLEAQLDAFERRQPSMRIARIRPCGIVQGRPPPSWSAGCSGRGCRARSSAGDRCRCPCGRICGCSSSTPTMSPRPSG